MYYFFRKFVTLQDGINVSLRRVQYILQTDKQPVTSLTGPVFWSEVEVLCDDLKICLGRQPVAEALKPEHARF